MNGQDIETAVSNGLKDAFKDIGIDARDWQELQKDFAYLRKKREAEELAAVWLKRGVIGTLITGTAVLLSLGAQAMFGKGHP